MKVSDLAILITYKNGNEYELVCSKNLCLRVNNVQRTKLDKNIEIIHEVQDELILSQYVEESLDLEKVEIINKNTGNVLSEFDDFDLPYYTLYNDNYNGKVIEVIYIPIK